MKKLILLLSFFLLQSAFCIAQTNVYHPFPDSNAVWTEHNQGCCAYDCPPPPTPNPVFDDYYISYFIDGDTMISSNSYHKIYESGSLHEHCDFGASVDYWSPISKTYEGAYRQDTVLKKVFFMYRSYTSECLLYNFSLNVGDTLKGNCQNNCTVPVASIDSVLIGNNYRKRFNLPSPYSYSLIEGIGSTSGLLETFCPFEFWGSLTCFMQNGQTLYPDTTTSCELLTHVKEIKEQSLFSIFPNPSNDNFTIEAPQATIEITNIQGQVIKQQTTNTETTNINVSALAKGMYFIKVKTEKGVAVKKLVKE